MKKVLYILHIALLLSALPSQAQSLLTGARQLQQTLGSDSVQVESELRDIEQELGLADDTSAPAPPAKPTFTVPDTTLPLGWIPERSQQLVNDYTGILTAEQAAEIERRLLRCYDSCKVEIALLITPDLGGDAIESFVQNVWRSWKIGNSEKDNGLLILIKPKNSSDGQVRIQTGYGLEGALPDAFCRRIIDEQMIPQFQQNDYYQAILDALDVIIPVCKGEYSLDDYEADHDGPVWPIFLFLLLFIIVVLLLSGDTKHGGGSSFGGTSFGGFGGPTFGGSSFGGSSFGGGGFGGFGGGSSGGGGASGRW